MLERDAAAGQGVRVAGLCWVLGWVLRLRGEKGRARAHLERGLAESSRDGRELDALRLGFELSWSRWPPVTGRRLPDWCGPAGPGPPTRTCAA